MQFPELPTSINDNQLSRRWYMGADHVGSSERLIDYIPAAQKLIHRFCKQPFKYDAEDSDYGYLEYQLCGLLDDLRRMPQTRHYTLSMLGLLLEQPKLKMYNVSDLPF